MPDTRSVLDYFTNHLHYDSTREYTHRVGDVAYLEAGRLARPADMPRGQKVIAAAIVAAAVIIGVVVLNSTIIASWRANMNVEQAIVDNLSREASIVTVPDMASLINQDDEAIRASFEQAGFKVYDASKMYDSNDMTLFKLPSDMSVQDASKLYMRGMGALNADEATRLLNGSWYFATDRVNGTSMVVRYADFATDDPAIAVQSALAKEGFDPQSVSEQGVDESGNTYSMGTLTSGETQCSWKISAIKLEDMYSIKSLPEDACYVGIRVTAA